MGLSVSWLLYHKIVLLVGSALVEELISEIDVSYMQFGNTRAKHGIAMVVNKVMVI